jgi:glycosyltransferase involved in cell wall biosynthesis
MSPQPGTRIMMTTDAVGGVWIFAATLSRALGARGFHVLLVTLGPKPAAALRKMILGSPGISLIETDLALEWQEPRGADLGRARSVLEELAERFGPDLVHLNGFREATFDWKVPTVLVAHSCVNSWAVACGETQHFRGADWRIYTSNVQAGLQNADVWVAPTSAFRDQLAEQYRLRARGQRIWNGSANRGVRSDAKKPFILGAGRVWDKAKNLSALASGASRFDWPVRIAGPSNIDGGLAPSAGPGSEFLGELSHPALLRQMDRASIFVGPALYEPFGLTVLEAANAGCALVLSDIPTFRELWDGAAVFFDPRDNDALTACLHALCKDDVQRRRLQGFAADRARRYSIGNTVDAYLALYKTLLRSGFDRSSAPELREISA